MNEPSFTVWPAGIIRFLRQTLFQFSICKSKLTVRYSVHSWLILWPGLDGSEVFYCKRNKRRHLRMIHCGDVTRTAC